jgi:hypothetical protein
MKVIHPFDTVVRPAFVEFDYYKLPKRVMNIDSACLAAIEGYEYSSGQPSRELRGIAKSLFFGMCVCEDDYFRDVQA